MLRERGGLTKIQFSTNCRTRHEYIHVRCK
jgi:hypothetical protein